MSANETIRNTRLRLGLSEDDVAARAGLSWNDYFDLELHEDEALDVAKGATPVKLSTVGNPLRDHVWWRW